MTPLARRVLRTIRRRALFEPSARVAIAVSGGADSVALVWLLRELEAESRCALAGLIHVHHGLRGEDADADEAFCRALADRLQRPIEVTRVDVAALAQSSRRSLETTARDVRYAFFRRAARALGAGFVATGHTLDDQAETVLLRLLRGAGTRGLTGIRPRREIFVRPLIDCRRDDLRRYLTSRGETFREDVSNRDLSIARNRIRHELMPIATRLAPRAAQALSRLAALAADDEQFLVDRATEAARTLVLSEVTDVEPGGGSGQVRLDVSRLAGLPAALGRRVIRQFVESLQPATALTARHIEAVRDLAAADKPGGQLDLPGLAVRRRSGVLAISSRSEVVPAPAPFEYALPVPGSVRVAEAGVTILARQAAGASAGDSLRATGSKTIVQASAVTLPLAVRNRRAGDRLRPLGAPGRRKVQDLFVDRKIPCAERDRRPIVVDTAGRIVWVVGVTIAEECRVTAPEAGVVILEVLKE